MKISKGAGWQLTKTCRLKLYAANRKKKLIPYINHPCQLKTWNVYYFNIVRVQYLHPRQVINLNKSMTIRYIHACYGMLVTHSLLVRTSVHITNYLPNTTLKQLLQASWLVSSLYISEPLIWYPLHTFKAQKYSYHTLLAAYP